MEAPEPAKSDGHNGDGSAIKRRWTKAVDKVIEKETRSWSDFTQGTTLHGLKYIFEPTFRVRRIAWLLAVLAAMVIFAVQVLLRGSDYFRYETNVDVQVVYRDEAAFPAVTLCNQNNFRLTAIADLGLYNFIDAVYSADNVSEIDFSKYNLDGIETETLLRQAAHQKSDLIESCYWRGKPCDIEVDFQEQLTGLGVCYTFNSGKNGSVLVADKPGSRSGLRLILNLEQYEYTKGAQSDAGLKILLHGQSEYPLMEDMGFAAAPGTHTLVGVNTAKVKNLPAPYGTCNEEGVPMSDCVRDCRTQQVTDRCNCIAPHMEELIDLPSEDCSIEEYFTCANNNDGDTYASENENITSCDCHLLCERTQYESSLSYAQLSRFNIERVVFKDARRRDRVWQNQYLARETFQRVDEAVVAQDSAEYADLLTYSNELMTLVKNLSKLFSEDVQFAMLRNMSSALTNDLDTFEREYNRRWYVLNDLWTVAVLNDGSVGKPVNFTTHLFRYVNEKNLTDNLVSCLDVYSRGGNTTRCDDLVYYSYGMFQYLQQLGETVHSHILMAYTSYMATMGELYRDTPINPLNLTEHKQCVSAFEAATNGPTNDVLAETVTALGRVVNTTTSVDYINEVQAIYDIANSARFRDAMLAFESLEKSFSWFSEYTGQWDTDIYAATYTLNYETFNMNNLVGTVQKRVLPTLSDTESIIHDNVLVILWNTLQYMNGSIWKLDLYHQLQYATIRDTPDDLDVKTSQLLAHLKTVISEYDLIDAQLHRGFKDLFQLPLPLVSNEVFANLELLSWAESLQVPEISHLVGKLYTHEDKTDTMMAFVTSVIDFLRKPVQDLDERVFDTAGNLIDTMIQQQDKLHQFAEEVTARDVFYMSNFLKVDIYYKELKFDKIEQFPAFQALSLLGEVGGFLGLLLGASVLTLIELFDFIAMSLVHKFGNKAPGNTQHERSQT